MHININPSFLISGYTNHGSCVHDSYLGGPFNAHIDENLKKKKRIFSKYFMLFSGDITFC